MSPLVFVLLLEGKANLKGCGTLELPSSDAMNQSSPDVIDRLHAIKEVDLTKSKIGFSVAGRERQYIRVARGAEQQTGVASGQPPSIGRGTFFAVLTQLPLVSHQVTSRPSRTCRSRFWTCPNHTRIGQSSPVSPCARGADQ